MAEQIENIEHDLHEAQRDLQMAVSEVSRKIEHTEARLIRDSATVIAVGAAAAVGIWLGGSRRRPLMSAALMLAGVGAFWKLRSTPRNNTGR